MKAPTNLHSYNFFSETNAVHFPVENFVMTIPVTVSQAAWRI